MWFFKVLRLRFKFSSVLFVALVKVLDPQYLTFKLFGFL